MLIDELLSNLKMLETELCICERGGIHLLCRSPKHKEAITKEVLDFVSIHRIYMASWLGKEINQIECSDHVTHPVRELSFPDELLEFWANWCLKSEESSLESVNLGETEINGEMVPITKLISIGKESLAKYEKNWQPLYFEFGIHIVKLLHSSLTSIQEGTLFPLEDSE